ncbi:MAG: fused MFS/spermidine synthase [Gammaproteobacteria bacterium]|nr:fused MFS/spermidine synthase [Gammaproteobacteria bacterium]
MSQQLARAKLTWFGFVVFVSSAIVMVLEITAGRLLAPFVGVSLYTWTSIIGVVLAGLSVGSWLGGRWADAGAGEKHIGIVLSTAAVLTLASLGLLTLIAPGLQGAELSLISSSFIYMCVLFLLPAMLLGIVTPLLTTMSLKLDSRAGHIVGRMHALAALGSIIGTFITGYWLVQYFGTRNIVAICAAVLLVLGLPFFRPPRQGAYIGVLMAVLLVSGVTAIRDGFSNPCNKESNYFCIRVDAYNEDLPFGEAKAMILDHLLHGVNHKQEPGMFISPYVHLMDELVLGFFGGDRAQTLNYFFAGGGAYTQPRGVAYFAPDAKVTVAELDPYVTQLAQENLYLDTNGMNVIHKDARLVLQETTELFDVVVSDVYHDIAIPYHLVTNEYHQLVKERLAPDGLYVTNIVDIFPDPRFLKSMIKTLSASFKYVQVWLESIPETSARVTYVVSASNAMPIPEVVQAQRGFSRAWLDISEPLYTTGTSMKEVPVLTDDFAPVDRLLSGLLLTEAGK